MLKLIKDIFSIFIDVNKKQDSLEKNAEANSREAIK